MKTISFRPAEPEQDFAQIAIWFSSLEDEPTTEITLKEYYEKEMHRIIQQVAEDEQGKMIGFYWMVHDRLVPGRASFDLFVEPKMRDQGTGFQLYDHLSLAVKGTGVKILRVNVWDSFPGYREFAEQRGFKERLHRFGMSLNLETFNDQPYDEIIARLTRDGFVFSSMQAMGNTEECQRKLFTLNDTTAATTPGTDGEHSWESFEDFQKRVCQAEWYKPTGQIMAIDTATGSWAAMSAITRLQGNNYAYNLFTGVDITYRGRKLGQAVKVLALRHARDVLKVTLVRTHHNTKNLPMIAIDHKLGYTAMPGTFLMEKELE